VDKARLTAIQKCGNNVLLKDTKAALEKAGAVAQRKTIIKHAFKDKMDKAVSGEESTFPKALEMMKSYHNQVGALKG
jgi:hypothetical protein